LRVIKNALVGSPALRTSPRPLTIPPNQLHPAPERTVSGLHRKSEWYRLCGRACVCRRRIDGELSVIGKLRGPTETQALQQHHPCPRGPRNPLGEPALALPRV